MVCIQVLVKFSYVPSSLKKVEAIYLTEMNFGERKYFFKYNYVIHIIFRS